MNDWCAFWASRLTLYVWVALCGLWLYKIWGPMAMFCLTWLVAFIGLLLLDNPPICLPHRLNLHRDIAVSFFAEGVVAIFWFYVAIICIGVVRLVLRL